MVNALKAPVTTSANFSTKNVSSVAGKTVLTSSQADIYKWEDCSKLVDRWQRIHDRHDANVF